MAPKVQSKMDFIKIVKRMKRQALTREKMFAEHIFDKGSGYIRSFQNTAVKNPSSPTRTRAGKRQEETLYWRGFTDGSTLRRCLISLATRGGNAD